MSSEWGASKERSVLFALVIGMAIALAFVWYLKERDVMLAQLEAFQACPECTDPNLVVKYPRGPIEFTADFYGMKYVGNSKELVDRILLHYGAWEKPVLMLLRDVTRSLEGDVTFVDVGANTGQHSPALRQRKG